MADTEVIYYVDQNDEPTGETAPKLEAHHAQTRLHAAFSCYIFNDKGQFLVTQRAHSKKVWPDVWTNSVCGHPAPGESREAALVRRTAYELGMKVKEIKVILPKYIYKTPPYNGIIEHEFCPVYVAIADSDVQPNPEEVEAYKWLDWKEYVAKAEADTVDEWSWWCKDQLKQLKDNQLFRSFLVGLVAE
jgi:isopentenyl-diphosphate delta-isomerase